MSDRMRSFPFYRELIREEVEKNLPEEFAGYEVRAFRVSEMYRNRDVLKIVPPKNVTEEIEASIFLENIYEIYYISGDMEAALQKVWTLLGDAVCENKAMTKENIIFCLVDVKGHENLLDAYPHRNFHGLSVLYRLYDGQMDHDRYPSFITNEMAAFYGYDEETLFSCAFSNTKNWYEPQIMTIGESFYEIIKNSSIDSEIRAGLPETLKNENDLYVLTNEVRFNAAAYLLYDDVLKKIGECVGSDYFLIPSTVYEVEIMPAVDGKPKDERRMLLESQPDEMEPGELLTSKVYFYDRTKKELRLYPVNSEKEGVNA